ncbi:MAG: hypothetical protein A3I78_05480 [Gammaproteobacteria bacterium RIFCSPLOWO2_02_FULL_56_15]|nr:MAG: hypothetical protein A3I78_05480 [Gammaproteobacteria bacterium RIFCSPLOWO2_02_FULL_56_15]
MEANLLAEVARNDGTAIFFIGTLAKSPRCPLYNVLLAGFASSRCQLYNTILAGFAAWRVNVAWME